MGSVPRSSVRTTLGLIPMDNMGNKSLFFPCNHLGNTWDGTCSWPWWAVSTPAVSGANRSGPGQHARRGRGRPKARRFGVDARPVGGYQTISIMAVQVDGV